MFMELSDAMLERVVGGAQGGDMAQAVKIVCMEIAERITAAVEVLNAGREVTLSIDAADVFPDTAVRIRKQGSEILVIFDTANLQSAQALVGYMGEMRSELMNRLPHMDYIEVVLNYR